jgi:hypothetical protein
LKPIINDKQIAISAIGRLLSFFLDFRSITARQELSRRSPAAEKHDVENARESSENKRSFFRMGV